MCGIIACLSYTKDVKHLIMSALFHMRNRGYDSAGVTFVSSNHCFHNKLASSQSTFDSLDMLDESVRNETLQYHVGIGHTRWATTGVVSDKNAHPHVSGPYHIVHNGIISNYQHFCPDSESDSAVIAHQLNHFKGSLLQAVSGLTGTWAIVGVNQDNPDEIQLAKNGSPLLLAFNAARTTLWIASEVSAFSDKVSTYISIPDETVLTIAKSKQDNCFTINDELIDDFLQQHNVHHCQAMLSTTPEPYKFWTEKEIHEQPEALKRCVKGRLHLDNVDLKELKDFQPNKIRHILMVACGTSKFAATLAQETFRTLRVSTTVQVIDASEFQVHDIPATVHLDHVACIIVSQSGETKDCQRVIELLPKSVVTIGVVNVEDSWIARETDYHICIKAGREVGVASTKSFTCQVSILRLLACWMHGFKQRKGFNEEVYISNTLFELALLSDQIKKALPNLFDIADQHKHHVIEAKGSRFILGRGVGYAAAHESALKMKELTYLSFEGYAGGSLKHGPFSLLSESSLCFLICLDGPHFENMIHCYHEIKARKAKVIVVTDKATEFDEKENIVSLGDDNEFECTGAILSVVYFQILSLITSQQLGNHPDYPRSLSKSVTVL